MPIVQFRGVSSDNWSTWASFKQSDPQMPAISWSEPYGTGTKKNVMMMCSVPAELIDQRGVTGRQRDVPEKSELGAIIESLWGKASIRWTKYPLSDYVPFCISLTFLFLRCWFSAKFSLGGTPRGQTPRGRFLPKLQTNWAQIRGLYVGVGFEALWVRCKQQESINAFALMMSLTSNRRTEQLPFETVRNMSLIRSPPHF